MSDMWALPDPPNSPLEKINYDTYLENIRPNLEGILSENPTKEEILRAFTYHDENLRRYFERHDKELKYWANIHTHPGGGGSAAPLQGEWSNEWWASDPPMLERELADGDLAEPWYDTAGAAPFERNPGKWLNEGPYLNWRPTIEVRTVSSTTFRSVGYTRLAAPFSVVCVWTYPAASDVPLSTRTLVTGGFGLSVVDRKYRFFAGSSLQDTTFTVPGQTPQIVICEADGVDSKITANGNEVIVGDAGSSTMISDLHIGSTSGGTYKLDPDISYLALMDRTLTNGEKADLYGWAANLYNVPSA